jgi:hypothetical protein
MLEVGRGGCSQAQYQAHFSLWAMLKAPLILGNDLRALQPSPADPTFRIISNKAVIAVNQDALGWQARRVWSSADAYSRGEQGAAPTHVLTGRCAAQAQATQLPADTPAPHTDRPQDQEWQLDADGLLRHVDNPDLCLVEGPGRTHSNELSAGEAEDGGSPGKRVYAPSGKVDRSNLAEAALAAWEAFEAQHGPAHGPGGRSVSLGACGPTATRWAVGSGTGGNVVSQASGLCLEVATAEEQALAQGTRVQTGPCRELVSSHYSQGAFDFNVRESQSWVAPSGWHSGSGSGSHQASGNDGTDGDGGAHSSVVLSLYQRQCLTVEHDAQPSTHEAYVTALSDGSAVLMLLNTTPLPTEMAVPVAKINMGLEGSGFQLKSRRSYTLTDLWKEESDSSDRTLTGLSADGSTEATSAIKALVGGGAVRMFKITPKD